MMPAVAKKIAELVQAGATIIVNDAPEQSYSLEQSATADKQVKAFAGTIWKKLPAGKLMTWKVGKGTVIQGPYKENSFEPIGITKDLAAVDAFSKPAKDIAWTHRKGDGFDIYFISNQRNEERMVEVSLRVKDRLPEIWDPVTGEQHKAETFVYGNGCTTLPLQLAANGSVFIVLRQTAKASTGIGLKDKTITGIAMRNPWTVTFDSTKGGPAQPMVFEQLKDWSTDSNAAIKYYSGTAVYTTTFDFYSTAAGAKVWLDAGKVANLAEVFINDKPCGVIWTAPYRVDVTKELRSGKNDLRIEVTNTWANRLKGDLLLPEKERITWTTAPLGLKDKPLLSAGLLGPVKLRIEKYIEH
jgi:hypothetical protein